MQLSFVLNSPFCNELFSILSSEYYQFFYLHDLLPIILGPIQIQIGPN